MKICIITASREQGGASINAFDVAKGMAGKGHRVVFISSGEDSESYDIEGYRIEIIGQKYRTPLFHYFNPFLLWKLKRIFQKENPDIVHVHSVNLQSFSLCSLLYSRRYPMIWTLHDLWPLCLTGWPNPPDCRRFEQQCHSCESWPYWIVKTNRLLKETAFKWSRMGIVCPSRWIADMLHESHLSRLPTYTIPYGIDRSLFCAETSSKTVSKNDFPHRERTVLFSGGLKLAGQLPAERKGWNYLSAALKMLPADLGNIRLAYVGDPIDLPADLPVKVQFEIGSNRHAMKRRYNNADVFVLPTLADNSPLTILEAMACKVPVISTHVGGIPEMIISGETGILCPPRDANALAEAIQWMLINPNRAAQMAEKAYQRFIDKFTLEQMISSYQEVYLETIRRFKQDDVTKEG